MWCSAATLTSTTHGATGTARPARSTSAVDPERAEPHRDARRTGAEPGTGRGRPGRVRSSAALTGTGRPSQPGDQPRHDAGAAPPPGRRCRSGVRSSSWSWAVAAPVSTSPGSSRTRSSMPGRGPVVAGQQQHPVGERPVGRELGEVDGAQVPGGRRVVLEAGGVPQPVVVAPRPSSSPSRRAPRPRAGRCGRSGTGPSRPASANGVGGGGLAGGEGGAEPHADRGDVGDAEVEEVLAGGLDAGQPGRAPGRGRPGGRRSHRCRRSRSAARRCPCSASSSASRRKVRCADAALLPHRRAEDRRRRGPGRRPASTPSRRAGAPRDRTTPGCGRARRRCGPSVMRDQRARPDLPRPGPRRRCRGWRTGPA